MHKAYFIKKSYLLENFARLCFHAIFLIPKIKSSIAILKSSEFKYIQVSKNVRVTFESDCVHFSNSPSDKNWFKFFSKLKQNYRETCAHSCATSNYWEERLNGASDFIRDQLDSTQSVNREKLTFTKVQNRCVSNEQRLS